MPIAITTPGVPPAAARKAVRPAGKTTVVEATRCGRVRLPRPDATLIVCVQLCAVSMQTAQRVLAAVPTEATPIVCLLDSPTVPRGLHQRFDCPVRCLPLTRRKMTSDGNPR